MNGGAVKDDRSPEKLAIDFRNALHDPLFCADTAPPSFSDILAGVRLESRLVVLLGVDCFVRKNISLFGRYRECLEVDRRRLS